MHITKSIFTVLFLSFPSRDLFEQRIDEITSIDYIKMRKYTHIIEDIYISFLAAIIYIKINFTPNKTYFTSNKALIDTKYTID